MSVAAEASQPDASPRSSGLPRLSAGRFGAVLLLLIAMPCFLTLFWTLGTPGHVEKGTRYNDQRLDKATQLQSPGSVTFQKDEAAPVLNFFEPLGTDDLGRSVLVRCLLGGAISLGVGICAALLAVFIGVTWGAAAGYLGGRTDSFMMRIVDIFYGLPYLLLVVMLSVAVNGLVDRFFGGSVQLPDRVFIFDRTLPWSSFWLGATLVVLFVTLGLGLLWLLEATGAGLPTLSKRMTFAARGVAVFFLIQAVFVTVAGIIISALWYGGDLAVNLLVLIFAIGGVSWLTMARVIRGQVLSLRSQPFIEAARAQGMGPARIIRVHLLPNLIGPIVVYTTLAVPQAILQESFLSFLGIGVQEPLPSWGQLASDGVEELPSLAMPELAFNWWLLVFPCVLLGLTLMSLNFMGDALRERFDPRSAKR